MKSKKHTIDTALSSLAHPYRRQLLVALLDHNPQDDDDRDPLDIVAADKEPDVLQSELIHTHLPALENNGYISWNRETNEISKGPNWDEIGPLIELMHAHQDELPDGWL